MRKCRCMGFRTHDFVGGAFPERARASDPTHDAIGQTYSILAGEVRSFAVYEEKGERKSTIRGFRNGSRSDGVGCGNHCHSYFRRDSTTGKNNFVTFLGHVQ